MKTTSASLAAIGTAGIVIGMAITATAGSADDQGPLCNTVHNSNGAVIVTGTGKLLVHNDTEACPQLEQRTVEGARSEPEPIAITIAGDVAFELGRSDIKPSFKAKLDEIAARLKERPDTLLEVVGHADSKGSKIYNQRLSEMRAKAAADYLTAAGVLGGRLIIRGAGEGDPVASNETEDGRARNRRVEIRSL